MAAETDRGRKQTFLKRTVTALERLKVRLADESNPDAIPKQPPVDLYDALFHYPWKLYGIYWCLQHSYCVIAREKDGTRPADAQ